MDKAEKTYMSESAIKYIDLSEHEKNEFNIRILNKIYTSFFIFEPKNNKIISSKEVIESVILSEFTGFDKSSLIDVSNLLNDSELTEIIIWNSYMTPFLKIEYCPLKHKWSNWVENVFNEFVSRFYQYICVSEINWKIIIFTDIWEDFLNDSFIKLEELWYKKIELHSIIPKIIDLIADDIHNSDNNDSIRELWIHFPLSMLWYNSEIIWKMKEWKNITNDNNFKKLISYGLLDTVKISTDFNISFNNDNNGDKYRLYWFLFSKNNINIKIFNELWAFIKKIDWIDKESSSDNFAWLPIYVINSKKVYENKESYPYFTYEIKYSESKERNELILELTFDWNWSDSINWNYIITWTFPQYFKERLYNDIKWECCYLTRNENKDEWELLDSEILEIFGNEKKIQCDIFLNKIREGYAKNYIYKPNSTWWLGEHDKPNMSAWDLFLTAVNIDNRSNDYLINISTPKRSNQIKLWHKITVNIFKLSSFNFNIDNIKWIIKSYYDKYNWKFLINRPVLGTISKVLDVKWHEFQINWNKLFNIATVYYPSKWNNKPKIKSWIFELTDLWKINKKIYINNELKLEDVWSMAFIELLKKNWHQSFFWWRSNWWSTRELADIISINEYVNNKKNKIININLFHMKKDPFEQKSESTHSIAFSTYTVVLWQILEKIKSFLYQKDYDWILESLKMFFDEGEWNYEIFLAIKKAINNNRKNVINFNIYFPIKEKDYFNTTGVDSNFNNRLALETNWKRLKIVNDIFKSNVDNVANNDYKMKINLNLWLVICKKWYLYNNNNKTKWGIETELSIINNINNSLFNLC